MTSQRPNVPHAARAALPPCGEFRPKNIFFNYLIWDEHPRGRVPLTVRLGRQDLGEQPLQAVDAGQEPAVGAVVRRGGGQRGLGGGAGERCVREVYHADVDALVGEGRAFGGAPGVAGARPLAAGFGLGLRVGLAAPRLAAGGRVRHPAVGGVGAGRVTSGRVGDLALLVAAHGLLRVRAEGLPLAGDPVVQRGHVEVARRRGQVRGAAGSVAVVLGGAARRLGAQPQLREVALVHYQ